MLLDACHPDRPLIFCPAVRQIVSQPAIKIRDSGATKDQNMGLRLLMHLEIIFFPATVKVKLIGFIGRGRPELKASSPHISVPDCCSSQCFDCYSFKKSRNINMKQLIKPMFTYVLSRKQCCNIFPYLFFFNYAVL